VELEIIAEKHEEDEEVDIGRRKRQRLRKIVPTVKPHNLLSNIYKYIDVEE